MKLAIFVDAPEILLEYRLLMRLWIRRLYGWGWRGALGGLLLLISCTHTVTTTVVDVEERLTDKECVAIFPFDNATQVPNAGRIVADLMATEFYKSHKFRLMERTELERIAQLSRVVFPEKMDPRFARSLGEVLEVDAVLIGSVNEFAYLDPTVGNPGVSIAAHLIDVSTGEPLWVSSHSRTSKDQIQYKKDPLSGIAMVAVAHMTKSLFRKVPPRTVDYAKICGNSQAILPPAIPGWEEEFNPTEGILAGRTLRQDGSVLGSVILEFPNRGLSRILSDPETGNFKMERLSPGMIRIVASKEGFKSETVETEVRGGKTQILDVVLSKAEVKEKKTGTVSGKVLDVKGNPVAATIFLKAKGAAMDLKSATDEKGRFSLNVPAANYSVRIVANGFVTQNKTIKVEDKSKVILNINLHPERTF